MVRLISPSRMLRVNQALAPAALVHALVLICGVTYTSAVGNAVVSTTLILGASGYRSKLLSAEPTVGAGVADILRANVPAAIVDFTEVAMGDGDAEIVVTASMIIGTPQVMSSEEAKTSITQSLADNPLSEHVADLNGKLEKALGAPDGTADYVRSIKDTSVTAKPYGDDAKDNGWGLGGAVIQGMVILGDAEYRTKLLAENREAANIGFQRYIAGIPGASTIQVVLNPNYKNDNNVDFIAEVTIDGTKSNKAARDDTKFYLEKVGLDVAALSSILGGVIEKPENGSEVVTGIEVIYIQAWAMTDPDDSLSDAGMATLSVALRLGNETYTEMFFNPDKKAAVEARIRALINQIPTVSVKRGGVATFKGYESDIVLYTVTIRVHNTTSNKHAKLRVEQYIKRPANRDVEGLNAQLVDALGLPPIEGKPYVLRFEEWIVKAVKEEDHSVDDNGIVTFYTLITASSKEEREALLARAGDAEQALETAFSKSFVPMESISAVNVEAEGASVSAASNDTVISGEVTIILGSARSKKEARDKFRELDLGEMSKITYGFLVEELNKLQGGSTLSSITSVEITGVFTKQSDLDYGATGRMARVSTVLQNVGFDKDGFHDKNRAYCAFEERFAQDLEAIVRQGCGCNALAEILQVTFGSNSEGGRRLLDQEVTVESCVYGAVPQEVDAALKGQCHEGCVLGGSDAEGGTMVVKAVKEGSSAPAARMGGLGLAFALFLAFLI